MPPLHETLPVPRGWSGMIWAHRASAHRHPHHTHDELELNLALRGRATYAVGGHRVELERDHLIWLFPGQEHALVDQSRDFAMWIGVFSPELVAGAVAEGPAERAELAARDPGGPRCRRLGSADARLLAATAAALANSPGPSHANAGLGWFLRHAWHAWGGAAEPAPAVELHPAVERAAHLLRRGEVAGGLPGLARVCGLSPSRLSRLFAQQLGVAVGDYRARTRLERFQARVAAGATRAAAACAAGFGSYSQAHRVHVRLHGVPPRALAADPHDEQAP